MEQVFFHSAVTKFYVYILTYMPKIVWQRL